MTSPLVKKQIDSAMEAMMTTPLAKKQQLDVYHNKRKRDFLQRTTTAPLPTRKRGETLPESAYLPTFRIPPFVPEVTDPIIDIELQAFMVELDRCNGPDNYTHLTMEPSREALVRGDALIDSGASHSTSTSPSDFICHGKCPRNRTDTPRPIEDFV